MRHTAFASSVLEAPIDRVWAFFDDFNGLPAFHPGIRDSRIESGEPRTVGAVRYLTLPDGFVRERLVKFEPSDFTLEYSILESSMPVRDYIARIELTPVTDSGATFAQWWADFTTEGVELASFAPVISEHVLATGLRAIGERLRLG
ncbi:SRPBCC family protein [Nocardia transvalensis]|uniref:SRPBCC family protein n=1 Tax=Nocardia transvalensis TaxID=37333 RepID=UPI0018955C96|nr:SRPBCC family protein [Nocardia transvalensis]MBF6333021.1 SRPBCC family protein [Nocardia transvalensis]